MKCQSFREAYSARLDNEEMGLEAAALDAHLASCPACRPWALTADQLTRQTRIIPAPEVPDLTAEILARASQATSGGLRPSSVSRFSSARPPHGSFRETLRGLRPSNVSRFSTNKADPTGTARLGLVMVALAQLAIAIPALAGADSGASVHIAHEQGSWALALAVGLLVVVWRPTRASGMLPLVSALVAGLTLTSGLDILNGRTAAGAEAPHGLAILGLMLLWWVAHPTTGQRPRQA
jgi:predicted anti-sigma-YlaC factor YlaD